jgi:hypothetical protein
MLESEAYNRVVFASIGLLAVGVIRLVRFMLTGHNRR